MPGCIAESPSWIAEKKCCIGETCYSVSNNILETISELIINWGKVSLKKNINCMEFPSKVRLPQLFDKKLCFNNHQSWVWTKINYFKAPFSYLRSVELHSVTHLYKVSYPNSCDKSCDIRMIETLICLESFHWLNLDDIITRSQSQLLHQVQSLQ